jgi:hypothetical protein
MAKTNKKWHNIEEFHHFDAGSGSDLFEGTVSRDFRSSVFSPINSPWVTDYNSKIRKERQNSWIFP